MSKRASTSAEVRSWASENGHTVGKRGRFGAELVKAYNAAHKSRPYSPATSGRTVEVKVSLTNKAGRAYSKTVEVSPTEYRELTGTQGKRGRVSAESHEVAAQALAQRLTAEASAPVTPSETPSE